MDYIGSSTPDVTYTYDALGNRLSMAAGTGTTSYVYDALNRPTSVSFPVQAGRGGQSYGHG